MKKVKYDIFFITNENRIWEIYNKKNTEINPDTIKYVNNFINELNKHKLSLFLKYGDFIPVLFFIYMFSMFIFAVLNILIMVPVCFFLFAFNMFFMGFYQYRKKFFHENIRDIYSMEKNKLLDYYYTEISIPFIADSSWYKIKFTFKPIVKNGFKKEIKHNQYFGNNQNFVINNNTNNNFMNNKNNNLGKNSKNDPINILDNNQDSLNMNLIPNYPEFEDVENNQNPHFK